MSAPIVMTVALQQWGAAAAGRAEWIASSLQRHQRGDWGDVEVEDNTANDDAKTQGGQLVSVYEIPADLLGTDHDHVGSIWIVTDDARDASSPTTILWPGES